ncbi:MAG TPA: TetR/AcrR family transcriptional regulator [Candidatus Dormibacteraeota bacterium]|nr:TetR/AcrR family transcriptional regulator [Candidatus Dormibacteraeota bacterium]
MPRVSAEHLEATRQRILDASRRCFVRNGFHVTSMQDILAEARLSVGAVYRYFPSKDDIVIAIVDAALDDVTESVRDIFDGPTPPALDVVIGRILRSGPPMDGSPTSARLMLQVWGEAARSPELRERYAASFQAWRAFITSIVEVYQRSGQLTSTVPAAHLTPALIAIVQGFMVQVALTGDIDVSALESGVRGLLMGREGNS